MRLRYAFLPLMIVTLFLSPALNADEFEWTGAAGSSDWNNPANWINVTTGGADADGIPDTDDQAEFPADSVVQGGTALGLVIPPNITLTIGGNSLSSVGAAGTISNQGVITFAEDDINSVGGRVDQRLLIDSAVTLDGGGTIRLNGIQTGIDSDTNSGILNNVDNTIRGNGAIQDITLSNQGSLIAEGGTLQIQNSTVDNTGGLIDIASDGSLQTSGATISGGTITGLAGAELRGDTFEDLTTTGTLTIGGGASGLSEAGFSGTITNQGEITFEADDTNSVGGRVDQRLLIDSAVTLDGGGTIRLNGIQTGIDSDTNSGILNNVDNTIRGNGAIQDITLSNQGSLIAEGGTLQIQNSTVDNTGGLIDIASDGSLQTSGATISGGTITGLAGAELRGDTFEDLTTTGTLTIGGGASGLSEAGFSGTISNQGVITFAEDDINSVGGRVDQRLLIDSAVTLDGGGTIRLNGVETGFDSDTFDGVLTNVDNTIRGNGTIQDITLNNQGTLIAEGGTLRVAGSVDSDNSGGIIELRSDGILDATGSDFDGGSILGSGGRISGGAFSNLSSNGQLRVGGGASGFSEAELSGTITNEGEITFEQDDTNSVGGRVDQRLLIDSAVTLDGGGTIRLNGVETGFDSDTFDGVLTNVDNTIRGNGTIQDITLNNQGTLIAEGGTLRVAGSVDSDNSGGIIELRSDGILDATGSDFDGGSILGSGGRISGGAFSNLSSNGQLRVGGGASGFSEAELSGTITNEGQITFEQDDTNSVGGRVDQRLLIDSAVTLDGGGTIRLNGTETGFDAVDANSVVFNVDNTIRGAGVVNVDFVNEGRIFADATDGIFDINEQLTLTDDGTLAVLLGGEQFAESGVFDVSDLLTVNGIFQPVVDSDTLLAEIGDTYVFLNGDIDIDSRFDAIDHSLAGQFRFDLIFTSNSIAVELVDIVAVPEPSSLVILLGLGTTIAMRRRRFTKAA